MNSVRLSLAAIAAVCLLARADAVKAADKPSATVTGSVTFRGKPLANGKIGLHPAKGKAVFATIKDGKFSLKGVPVGATRVTVTSDLVPKKYASPTTSGLKFNVGAEENQLNIELK
jgi:hypothetical protein